MVFPFSRNITSPYSQYSNPIHLFAHHCNQTSDIVNKTGDISKAIFSSNFNIFGYLPSNSIKADSSQNSYSPFLKWTGIILSLGIPFFLCTSYKGYLTAKDNFNETLNIKSTIQACENKEDPAKLHGPLKKLVDHQFQIDTLVKKKYTNYLGSTVIAVLGGIILTAGALASMPMLLIAGAISSVAGIIIGTINLIYFNTNLRKICCDYQLSQNMAQEILEIFNKNQAIFNLTKTS